MFTAFSVEISCQETKSGMRDTDSPDQHDGRAGSDGIDEAFQHPEAKADDRHQYGSVLPGIRIIRLLHHTPEGKVFYHFFHQCQHDEIIKSLIYQRILILDPGQPQNDITASGEQNDQQYALRAFQQRLVTERLIRFSLPLAIPEPAEKSDGRNKTYDTGQ